MSDLIVPFLPSNLIIPPHMKAKHVEGDMYKMCERVKEIDPNLLVVMLDEPVWKYAIVEQCADGVDRAVFRVKELDGRVLKEIGRIMAMPLNARLQEAERMEHQYEAEERERELDELYEEIGRPMWTQLEHDGFIDRGVSFPKAGVATKGKFRR